MHAFISVGYIYVINKMLDTIRMHSILMIEDYVYIYMDFKLLLLRIAGFLFIIKLLHIMHKL